MLWELISSEYRPIKVKVVLRDFWDNKDGSLQTNLAKLKSLLGYNVVIEPDWPNLVTSLSEYYDDNGQLAMAVATCVDAWCRSLVDLLDANMYPALTEALKSKTGLKVYPEVRNHLMCISCAR
jgi:hypothetical protein